MNIKDIILTLATAYVENYKREMRIYNALKNEEIYVDVEKDPYTSAIEKIFNKISGDFTSALLDFATDGFVSLKPNKFSPWEDVDNIEKIVEIYMDNLTN